MDQDKRRKQARGLTKTSGSVTVAAHLKSWVAGCLDAGLCLSAEHPGDLRRCRMRLFFRGHRSVVDEVAILLGLSLDSVTGKIDSASIEIPGNIVMETHVTYAPYMRSTGRDLLRLSASWHSTVGMFRGRGVLIPDKILLIRESVIKEYQRLKEIGAKKANEVLDNEPKLSYAADKGDDEVGQDSLTESNTL